MCGTAGRKKQQQSVNDLCRALDAVAQAQLLPLVPAPATSASAAAGSGGRVGGKGTAALSKAELAACRVYCDDWLPCKEGVPAVYVIVPGSC